MGVAKIIQNLSRKLENVKKYKKRCPISDEKAEERRRKKSLIGHLFPASLLPVFRHPIEKERKRRKEKNIFESPGNRGRKKKRFYCS